MCWNVEKAQFLPPQRRWAIKYPKKYHICESTDWNRHKTSLVFRLLVSVPIISLGFKSSNTQSEMLKPVGKVISKPKHNSSSFVYRRVLGR